MEPVLVEQKLFEVDRAVIGYFGSGPKALKLIKLFTVLDPDMDSGLDSESRSESRVLKKI